MVLMTRRERYHDVDRKYAVILIVLFIVVLVLMETISPTAFSVRPEIQEYFTGLLSGFG